MTGRSERGVRFVHPDLERDQGPPGLRVAPGGLETVQGDAAVRQAIQLLLSTRPGERVMRPRYGCDLQRLVFSPNDDTTAALAEHYVRRALETWEPRIEILALDATREVDASRLSILLEYRVRATQRRDRVSLRFSLDGGNP